MNLPIISNIHPEGIERSGRWLLILSFALFWLILVVFIALFFDLQSLEENAVLSHSIIDVGSRVPSQVQRELLRLKVSLLDGSDNEQIELYRSLVAQRMSEVLLAHNTADLRNAILEQTNRWHTELEPIIATILEKPDDLQLRQDAIIIIDDLELVFNGFVTRGELNRLNRVGTIYDTMVASTKTVQIVVTGLGVTMMSYVIIIGLIVKVYSRLQKINELTTRELRVSRDRLRNVLSVVISAKSTSEQLDELVKVCAIALDMEIGLVSKIEAPAYTIKHYYAPNFQIPPDFSCSLEATLCKMTIENKAITTATDLQKIYQPIKACFENLKPNNYIGMPISINGQVYGTFSFVSEQKRAQPFTEFDKNYVMMVGHWISATLERQENIENLSQYAKALEKSNEELTQFAYVASHDLQEPLRKIQLFGNRVIDLYGSSLDERGIDYLSRMQNSASRMQTFIKDILSLTSVSNKANPFSLVSLNAVITEIIQDLEVTITNKNAKISVGTFPMITADETQMKQLFLNLISNALKFSKDGICPEIIIESKIEICNKVPWVHISIKDNGIGFDSQFADRIFNMFQRLNGNHEYEGSGIGLALCRKIVERHHGTISATSTYGEGSVFDVTLPVYEVEKQLQ